MSARGPLAGYRALDLTDHRGALAGRLLADLGVDVVKVEPPGGEPDRLAPPFAGDPPGPTRSLAWLPSNFGKRSVALDLHRDEGRAAPLWGQQTEEVFGELLGLPRSEIERLWAVEVLW